MYTFDVINGIVRPEGYYLKLDTIEKYEKSLARVRELLLLDFSTEISDELFSELMLNMRSLRKYNALYKSQKNVSMLEYVLA